MLYRMSITAVIACSPSSPTLLPQGEKGAQIAAILEWRNSYGYRLAGACP